MASTALGHDLFLDGEPVVATEEEMQALAELERLVLSDASVRLRLVASGREVEVPETAARLFRHVVQHLADGNAVMISPLQRHLTVSQAADLLNVSDVELLEMLEQGEIPHAEMYGVPRIPLGDLLAYRNRRRAERRKHLDRLTQLSQEMGLYEPGRGLGEVKRLAEIQEDATDEHTLSPDAGRESS